MDAACERRDVESFAGWLPLLVLIPALGFSADCVNTSESEIRTFPRGVWLVILIFGSVVGGAAWFAFGRPTRPKRP
jgi:hypothetical protein